MSVQSGQQPPYVGEMKDGWYKAQASYFDTDQVRQAAIKKVIAWYANGRWYLEVQTKGIQPYSEQDRRLITRSLYLAYRSLMRFFSKLTRSRVPEQAQKPADVSAETSVVK